jgi:hypothetical protein
MVSPPLPINRATFNRNPHQLKPVSEGNVHVSTLAQCERTVRDFGAGAYTRSR